MGRIYFIIVAILCAVIGWYVFKDNRSQTKITALETENNALKGNISFMEKRIEKEHADTLALSQRYKELEDASKMDKSVFDWGYDISNTNVILRLRKN